MQPSLVAEFDKICTQFEEKPAVQLQSSSRSVHNCRKKQFYTYKACERQTLWFPLVNCYLVYISRKKQLYT